MNIQLSSQEIALIVEQLQHVNTKDIQEILSQLGMEEAMCKQLITTQPLYIVYDQLADRLNSEMTFEEDDDLDPAGGHGLHSHI